MTAREYPARAMLCLDTWAGKTRTEVDVIGETPKRYRIRARKKMQLAGRNRWLNPGETALVPSYAVEFIAEALTYPRAGARL